MILCCGEALIDMIPSRTFDGQTGFVPYPGGAVFNTAVALGRLGSDASLLTGLSNDIFGAQLRRFLAESHVDASFAVTTDRLTTLAFVSFSEGQASYSFFDENSAFRMLDIAEFPDLDSRIECLFFGGISLVSEPCAEAFASFLDREGDARLTMIDPNIRPDFIRDEARFRTRITRMMERCDIVKVSEDDLDWYFPDRRPIREKVRSVLTLGPSLVLATRGSSGAIAMSSAGAEVTMPAVETRVMDTVGAGDTFNAGFLSGLARMNRLARADIPDLSNAELKSAMGLANAAAAVTVSRAGANPPWESELELSGTP